MLTLRAINRFPVKSCRGQSLDEATVEPWGLAGDRRWMLVDDNGVQVTAREVPPLVLVRPVLRDPAAHAWFGRVVGRPVRLVYLDDPLRRAPDPRFAAPDDRVSLADGYPLLLTTTASLDALNDLIAAGPRSEEGPVPMTRFRPNVVVDGAGPWAEDGWRRVRIGRATFRAVEGCERCVFTTINPDTAAKGKEPIATLARHRRWDGATWFGMNLIPDTPGARIAVGDEVEVLAAAAAADGPPR